MDNRLQARNARKVILSDTVDIPRTVYASGTATSTVSGQLNDTAANFANVRPGDIIYNDTDSTATLVVRKLSNTSLQVADDIFASGEVYTVFSKGVNDGALIYVGVVGDVNVITSGGDTVLFKGVNAGQFMPIHIDRVLLTNTTATDIIAVW